MGSIPTTYTTQQLIDSQLVIFLCVNIKVILRGHKIKLCREFEDQESSYKGSNPFTLTFLLHGVCIVMANIPCCEHGEDGS